MQYNYLNFHQRSVPRNIPCLSPAAQHFPCNQRQSDARSAPARSAHERTREGRMPQRTTLPPPPENGNISLTSPPPLVRSLGSDTRRRRRRLRQYCGRIKLRSEVNQSVSRTVGFGRTAARTILYGVKVNSKFDGGSLNPSARPFRCKMRPYIAVSRQTASLSYPPAARTAQK